MRKNLAWLLGSVVLTAGSAQGYFAQLGASGEVPNSASCRETPRSPGGDSSLRVRWQSPADEEQRLALSAWCDAVGPAVIEPAPGKLTGLATSPESVVIASWNLHVGGADLPAFVAELRRGAFTNGTPVRDFVLLLQEAYRSGPEVPARAPGRAGVPSRIAPRPPSGARQDIVAAARELNLALFYVPSMRNGSDTGDRAEDRGNAILSTMPLSDFGAIELPFERQRRVAITAAVRGVDDQGGAWRLLVSSAHLDATAGLARLRVFASGLRAQQARALVTALDREGDPIVMGSDLNTWWNGRDEPAYRTLEGLFTATPRTAFATHSGGLTLDYLLFRLPPKWQGDVRLSGERFGSDHSPLIGRLALN